MSQDEKDRIMALNVHNACCIGRQEIPPKLMCGSFPEQVNYMSFSLPGNITKEQYFRLSRNIDFWLVRNQVKDRKERLRLLIEQTVMEASEL